MSSLPARCAASASRLFFLSGVASCLSQVVFWPYVAQYKPVYAAAMAVGERQRLIALCWALYRRRTDEQPLSRSRRTYLCCVLPLAACLALLLLRVWRGAHRESRRCDCRHRQHRADPEDNAALMSPSTSPQLRSSPSDNTSSHYSNSSSSSGGSHFPGAVCCRGTPRCVGRAATEQVLYSVLPYACLSYPDGRTVLLGRAAVAEPGTAGLGAGCARTQRSTHAAAVAVSVLWHTYVVLSATVVFAGRLGGGWLVVLLQTLAGIVLNYVRACVFVSLHRQHERDAAMRVRVTRVAGIALQAGSVTGSLLFFVLINYTHVFAS